MPAARISARVIFSWRVVSGMPIIPPIAHQGNPAHFGAGDFFLTKRNGPSVGRRRGRCGLEGPALLRKQSNRLADIRSDEEQLALK